MIPLSADKAKLITDVVPHHEKVLQDFKFIMTTEIAFLDKEISGTTLRDQLLDMQSTWTGKQLIHAVDFSTSRTEKATTVVVTVSSIHHSEAQQVMSFLPLQMKQQNSRFVGWFRDTGLFSDPSITWDEETQSYSTKSLKYMNNLKEETRDHFILPPELQRPIVEAPEDIELALFSNALQPNQAQHPYDDDASLSSSSTMQLGVSVGTTALRLELAAVRAKLLQAEGWYGFRDANSLVSSRTSSSSRPSTSSCRSGSSQSSSTSTKRIRSENDNLRQQLDQMQAEMLEICKQAQDQYKPSSSRESDSDVDSESDNGLGSELESDLELEFESPEEDNADSDAGISGDSPSTSPKDSRSFSPSTVSDLKTDHSSEVEQFIDRSLQEMGAVLV